MQTYFISIHKFLYGIKWEKCPRESSTLDRSDINSKILTKKLNKVISLVQDFSSNPLDAIGLEEMVEEPDAIEDEFLVKYVLVNYFLMITTHTVSPFCMNSNLLYYYVIFNCILITFVN